MRWIRILTLNCLNPYQRIDLVSPGDLTSSMEFQPDVLLSLSVEDSLIRNLIVSKKS